WREVGFAGGRFRMGSAGRDSRFVWDNEKGMHDVLVAPFAMASRPVTQGEYARFVDDGGRLPTHWRRTNGSYEIRRFDRWMPLEPDVPMMHVTQAEALAYCKHAGRR